MKVMKIMIMAHVLVFPLLIHAQGFFAQKKTKLKYIAQQIALFKLYGGYLKKGYDISKDGLKFINDVKHGDFDLHNNYFSSLNTVNSSVKEYAQKDSITNIQEEILFINDEIKSFTNDNDNIQQQEKDYIQRVMSNLLSECDKNLNQLVMLTTDSSVALKDDERLRRIDDVVADMKDKYAFAKYFENSVKILALSRAKDMNNVTTSKLLYGIK